MDYGRWSITTASGSMPAGIAGFIYLITNRVTNRRYVGKKVTVFNRSKKVVGKTRKVHSKVDSDWKTYAGSCEPLTRDIEKYGEENFSFEILAWGKTKGSIRYLEVWTIWQCDVMSGEKGPDGERFWYNASADSVRFMRPKDVTPELLSKVKAYIS